MPKRIDFGEAVDYARRVGLPGLLALDFQQRAARLKALAKYLGERKEELYAISAHTGATRVDGWIDIEGGSGTLFATPTWAQRAAQRQPGARRPGAEPGQEGPVRRHAHPGAARRCGGAHQRLQLPDLGPAGEVRAQLSGRHALHRQARHRHQLPDRGDGAHRSTKRPPAGRGAAAGDRRHRRPAGPPGRPDVVTFTGSADTAAKLRVHPNVVRHSIPSTPRPTR
jgi:oxepin-CoA hydrolase/3-oxo-5,6-dehydrosuberyl-CoA semialdehyde dehydrogenase